MALTGPHDRARGEKNPVGPWISTSQPVVGDSGFLDLLSSKRMKPNTERI